MSQLTSLVIFYESRRSPTRRYEPDDPWAGVAVAALDRTPIRTTSGGIPRGRHPTTPGCGCRGCARPMARTLEEDVGVRVLAPCLCFGRQATQEPNFGRSATFARSIWQR